MKDTNTEILESVFDRALAQPKLDSVEAPKSDGARGYVFADGGSHLVEYSTMWGGWVFVTGE